MPQSLAKVVTHIVFSTKQRYPFLASQEIRNEMHSYLGGTCNKIGCPVITVGGVADHVHVLCHLSRTLSIAQILQDIKQSSSAWVKTKGVEYGKFAWQNGYGIFSVSHSDIERVKNYIKTQEEHHRHKTFQEEFREFLKAYEIEYDERYMWD
jgi:REP element-mobilizing transposase RayT